MHRQPVGMNDNFLIIVWWSSKRGLRNRNRSCEQDFSNRKIHLLCTIGFNLDLKHNILIYNFWKGDFVKYFFSTLFNTASSVASSNSTVSDAGIEPRTVATLTLAARCTNHSARLIYYIYGNIQMLKSNFFTGCRPQFLTKKFKT